MVEESDREWGPLCFFPEATATNGVNLNRFRRGCFTPLRPINPAMFKNYINNVSPDYASLMALDFCFLMVSQLRFWRSEAHHYPTFVPNDYLFTEYAKTLDGGEKMEKWEIYAAALHDFIKTKGGFGDGLQANREKVKLQHFLWGKTDSIEVNGHTWEWKNNQVIRTNAQADDTKKQK